MEEKTLKERILDISTNRAETAVLIDQLLKDDRAKGVEPMHFCEPESEVVDELDCSSFKITETKRYMHYEEKGGYHIFVKRNYPAIFDVLKEVMGLLKKENIASLVTDKLDSEDELWIYIVLYVLKCPQVAFTDSRMQMEIANVILDNYKRIMDESTSILKEEDSAKNDEFEQNTLFMNEMVEKVRKEESERES